MEGAPLQEKIECLKNFTSKWTDVRKNDTEEILFPKSQTIHVGSLQDAHDVMKHQGLHLISMESIETYRASGFPEVYFPRATIGMEEVPSTEGNDCEEGHLTFISREFWKMIIVSPDGTLRLCWYLAKDAKKGGTEKDQINESDVSKAMSGALKSNVLPEQNENYLQKDAGTSWKEERDIMRTALKKSPAYLRGNVANQQKPGLPNIPETLLPGQKQSVGGKNEKKSSKYFSFVKRIVEMKRARRAAKKMSLSQDAGAFSSGLDELDEVKQGFQYNFHIGAGVSILHLMGRNLLIENSHL